MADDENAPPPSKKRSAGRELSRDNPGLDDEDDSFPESSGTFQRASDEVLAARRIVKVRRQQSTSSESPNPFAGIKLVPPTVPASTPAPVNANQPAEETKGVADVDSAISEVPPVSAARPVEESEGANVNSGFSEVSPASADRPVREKVVTNSESEHVKSSGKNPGSEINGVGDDVDKQADVDQSGDNHRSKSEDPSVQMGGFSSFRHLSSSKNAFTGLTGAGFSTSRPANLPSENEPQSFPSFSFANAGSVPLFGAPDVKTGNGISMPKEAIHETGEENEESVFQADSVLYEFDSGGWRERGKGEVKVNVSVDLQRGRLVMRTKGNYRLILNSNLYPEMKIADMDKRGVTFACVNGISERQSNAFSTFALKFKDSATVDEFRLAVEEHKAPPRPQSSLETPESSPKGEE